MADFKKAMEHVLRWEGTDYHDVAGDPGGATKFGISQRSYPNINIKELSPEMAAEIYERDFWLFQEVNSDEIATFCFDTVVNFGQSFGTKIIQYALRSGGRKVTVDGVVGPETLAALNAVDRDRFKKELRARRSFVHAKIALKKPVMIKFLYGWLRRDADFIRE